MAVYLSTRQVGVAQQFLYHRSVSDTHKLTGECVAENVWVHWAPERTHGGGGDYAFNLAGSEVTVGVTTEESRGLVDTADIRGKGRMVGT